MIPITIMISMRVNPERFLRNFILPVEFFFRRRATADGKCNLTISNPQATANALLAPSGPSSAEAGQLGDSAD
jgi:hypothetical protein